MKTVKKTFFVWGEQKEKAFLEKMAKDGYKLVKVKFNKYYFDDDSPKDVVYQFDFKGIENKISEDEYLSFYEDTGWTLNANYGGWYYFSKEIEEGKPIPTIYSDNSTKKQKYRRLLIFLLIIGFPLYYQLIVMFPNMPDGKLSFPHFYFFFRIFVSITSAFHLFALIKVFRIYSKIDANIKE